MHTGRVIKWCKLPGKDLKIFFRTSKRSMPFVFIIPFLGIYSVVLVKISSKDIYIYIYTHTHTHTEIFISVFYYGKFYTNIKVERIVQ